MKRLIKEKTGRLADNEHNNEMLQVSSPDLMGTALQNIVMLSKRILIDKK